MDPVEIGKLIVPLAALAGFYLKIQSSIRSMAGKGDMREITNNPLNVREAPEFMTRRECSIHHVAFEHRLSSLEHRFDKHIQEAKATTDAIRDDLSDIRTALGDRMGHIDDSLREITRSVGRLEGS